MKNIAVVGTGSWGLAVAQHLSKLNYFIDIVGRRQLIVDQINNEHECQNLPNIKLNSNIVGVINIDENKFYDCVILAVPSYALK